MKMRSKNRKQPQLAALALLAGLSAGMPPALAQSPGYDGLDQVVPMPAPSALPAGSCAELSETGARLDCLKTRIQRNETGLLPDLLAFLATNPQSADPQPAWMQALAQPALLRQLPAALKGQTNPVIRQHLLLLLQYVLISKPQLLEPATKTQFLEATRTFLDHAHWPTRLQASDIWLMHRKPEALPQLKALLAGSQVSRSLGLVHYQRWLSDPALSKQLPPLPAQSFLAWTQEAPEDLGWLKTWTFHPVFRSGEAGSFQAFLAAWLESSPADTVKLGENSLLFLLRHQHPGLRAFALRRLSQTGNPAYAARIEALFEDPDPDVRLRAKEALDQLQALIPLQYLESLKDPKRLPADAPARIKALMHSPETRGRLLEPAFRHLARHPVMLEELWSLLYSQSDPDLMVKALQTLAEAPATWPLAKLEPLLAPSQDVRVRTAAMATALKRPYSQEVATFIRPLLQDPQSELQLEMLDYLFKAKAQGDARSLLNLLAQKGNERIDQRLLSFDGAKSTSDLDDYVTKRLKAWIKLDGPRQQTLPDWLSWVRDPGLPRDWRRVTLRLIGDEGQQAILLPPLRQLMQDSEMALDAEFALEAIENRVQNKNW